MESAMQLCLPFVSARTMKFSAALVLSCAGAALGQNQSPATPQITEPTIGRIINSADLHMETAPFVDQDAGDTHRCTDWEVWTVTPSLRVWVTSCIAGIERVHTHLGDGVFENSHAGRRTLLAQTDYILRVRHRDSSNDASTEWSAFSTRPFTTGALTVQFPLQIDDVLNVPAPTFKQSGGSGDGSDVVLSGGASPGVVLIEGVGPGGSSTGTLLEIRGRIVGGNLLINPAGLAAHANVRVTVSAGGQALALPDCNAVFSDHAGVGVTLFLPAFSLSAGGVAQYWISSNGSSYVAAAGQTDPSFGNLARGAPVAWTTAADFRAEIVATGFQMPVNIAFIPNPGPLPTAPLYYVVELYGQIKVVRRNGVVSDYATGLLNFNPTGNFPGSGEQGVACAAVDPLNGDLYVTMVYSATPGVEAAPHHPAVDKLTSVDGGLTMSTRTRILNLAPETQGQSHQISNITFGPDGLLYVHVGDGFDAAAARNLSQFRGKILRITRTGAPVATNPYYNAADGITARDYIFASGVRNPFGGCWRQSDASHYIVENGPSVDRFSKLVSGRDYGYTGSDASMMIFALYNWTPSTAPVNIAFVQPETFGGSGFPASYSGRAYVAQSGPTYDIGPGDNRNKAITEWTIDNTGALASGPRTIAFYNGGGASTAVAIAAGPDGLYFSDFYKEDSTNNPIARGSNILRLRYLVPPPPPDCNANGVDDAMDLTSGFSRDCNANGIPDECDIATGRSGDCNENALPDECDTVTRLLTTFNTNLPAPFVLNGSAQMLNNAIRLTTAAGNLTGTAIRPPLSTAPLTRLHASFDFRIGNGSGADGICFAIFDSSRYTINQIFSEEGPGSTASGGSGPGTVVVQFDTYDNGGEGENTVEIMQNGVTLARATPTFDLEDYTWRRAFVDFDGTHISVRILTGAVSQTVINNVAVPNFQPFVALLGFAGRTGGATNEHWIDNVSFDVPGPNDLNSNGIPDECECVADYNRDGGVDGQDIEKFFIDFENGNIRADVNFDGGLTGDDVGVFFGQWETGGC